MERLGDSLRMISEALILAGAVIMLLSILCIRNIFKHEQARKYARRWKLMLVLMYIFLLGYITVLFAFHYTKPGNYSILVGIVFFLGSIFVYLAVKTSFFTINALGRYIDDLKTSVLAEKQLQGVLQNSRNTLLKQNEALLFLTKTILEEESLRQSFQVLTEKAAETLEVDRVSIWLFDEQKACISIMDLFEREKATHSHGLKFYRKDYPAYFNAHEHNGIVDAPAALSDVRLKEFTETYLKPLDITSLLELPIRTEGKLAGIFRNETVGHPRKWSFEEHGFVTALTEIIAIAIETFRRKKLAEQLALSESTFRNAFEHSGIGMALVSPEGKWIKVNKELCEIVGYPAHELLTKTFQDITHPDDLDADLKFVKEMLKGLRTIYKMEKRYFHKNGSIIWINLTVSLVRDTDGNPMYFISQIEDITEQKKTERDLELALSLTTATIESTADGILVVDTIGKITGYNKQFLRLWRIPEHIIKTNDDATVLEYAVKQLANPDRFEAKVKELYGSTQESYDILYFTDGRIFERFSKPQMTNCEMVGRVWSFRDVTKQKQAEAEIKELNADLEHRVELRTREVSELNEELKATIQNLEAANKDLESFSYSVSHDLRAPLRNINIFIGLLEEKNATLDGDSKRFLTKVSNSAKKMEHLIKDLLALSQMGKKDLEKEHIDMNELLREVVGSVNIHEWNEQTKLVVGDMLPANGDKSLLNQVFVNLISNAIKYSGPKENPVVEIGSYAGENENTYFVKDNGVGFSMDYYDKLFKVFQRMHSAEEFEGTGVGLAIVDRIIKKHGGKVWAEAIKDKGATFYFSLPKDNAPPIY